MIEDYSSNESEKKKLYSSATYTDDKNYLKTQTDQANNTTTYNYDTVNGTLLSVTNAAGNTTTYSYNPKNNDLLSVSADGHTNTYSYNNDRLTGINVNNSTHYKFNYDKFGRTVSTTVGNGTNSVILSALEYDQKGLMTKQTYGNKDYISFAYDSLDRLSEKSYNKEDGSSVAKKQYIYGNDGNISVTVDFASNSYTRYNYDLSGRTASIREYSGTDVSSNIPISYTEYKYADKTNYLTNVKHFSPIGTQNIAYKYGNINNGEMPDQVYSVSWNGIEKVTNKFDSLSRLSKRTVNGLATNYTYKDIEGNQTTTFVKSIETAGITNTYEYDSLGNITSIYDGSKTTTYKYDALNQLVRADNPYECKTHIYTYENGNITEDKVYEYTTGNLPEYPESKTQYLYENATWSDILTGVKKSHFDNGVEIIDDRYSISSDTIGNITNLNGLNYTWVGRQLKSVSPVGDSSVGATYSYNSDGQRIGKNITLDGGEVYDYDYYYNGDILAGYRLVITKSDGSSTTHNVAFMYDENGEAFGIETGGKEYFYVKNAQNDVIAIVNSNNETVATYRYNSWGKLISCEDTSENQEVSFLNPYTYRSYFYDSDTEMYFLKSRYYNPELHRFINADSIVSDTGGEILGYNMFAYCMNNPIKNSDDDGNWPKWATKVLIGTAVIAVAAVLTIATAGTGTALACFAAGALKGAVTGAIMGAASGAATSAVKHRIKKKTWKGAGKAALEGAATGYMTGAITGFVTGGLSSSTCFVAGTAVLSASGLVNIEQIRPGDKVWAENPETGQKGLKTVVRTFENETTELVHVFVNGEEIITTNEHPFYVPVKGWTSAIELRAGDILLLQNGSYVIVEKVQHEILEHPVKVYNFEVEDFHTYYVGNCSVLVHNKCVVNSKGVKVEVRTSREHGLPHAHVSGNGPNTTVGLDGLPMKNHPNFSPKQAKVISENWEAIKNGIIDIFKEVN